MTWNAKGERGKRELEINERNEISREKQKPRVQCESIKQFSGSPREKISKK